MTRYDYLDDAFAAKWGDPGAVTVGYIPEDHIPDTGKEVMKFNTSPQVAPKWGPITLKVESGE